jgi:Uma2 family endonuclease
MSTVSAFPTSAHLFPERGEPAWDLALAYPRQGDWSVEEYLRLDTGLLVEYTDGFIRVLPMPSVLHQWIVRSLFQLLNDFVRGHELGEVFFAPLPVQLRSATYREPDIVFLRPGRIKSLKAQPSGADLAIEVVSEGKENEERDYVEKRQEYADAGIAEYWIIDPQLRKITVLALAGREYREHGVFFDGQTATSRLLSGFEVPVEAVFDVCDAAAGE